MLPNSRVLRFSTWLLGALLLVVALPFGAVAPRSEMALRVACGLLLALTVTLEPIGGPLRRVSGPFLALVAIGAIGALQWLPLPPGLIEWVSPGHATWARQAAGLGAPVRAALSLAPGESLDAALDWFLVAAAFALGAAAGLSRRRRRLLVAAFSAAVVFQILYGMRAWLAGSREIWGVFVQSQPHRLKGTFVNPNHLALYLGLALCCLFAVTGWAVRQVRRHRLGDRAALTVGLPVLGWMVVFATLVFSGSRSGLLAVLVAAAAQGALMLLGASRRVMRWGVVAVGVAVLAAGVLAVLGTGGAASFDRLASTRLHDVSLTARSEAFAAALDLWPRFPILGVGLGAFDDAFAQVGPSAFDGAWWSHLHNDWLELLLTGGTVSLLLAIGGVFLLGRRLLQVARGGESSEDRFAGVAGFGILVFLAVMENAEFGLTNPANAVTAAVLLGAAAAARLAPPVPPERGDAVPEGLGISG